MCNRMKLKNQIRSNRLKQKNKWKRKINYYLATKGNELKGMFLQQLLSSIGEETKKVNKLEANWE